jgi:predicted nucleic acid-binding protein
MPPVLCNAGPLIALGKLNRLHLLADLYGTVSVPHAVYNEVVSEGQLRGLPDALTVRLFWEAQGWPVVDVSEALRAAYAPRY